MKKLMVIISFIIIQVGIYAQQMTADAYFARAVSMDELGRYEDAMKDLDELIKLSPKDAKAWNYRGLVYYHLDNFDAALVNYNQAIKLDAGFEMAWFNKGTLYLASKQYTEAITAFDASIRLNALEGAYSMRAQAYVGLEKYDEAIGDFNKAIQLNGSNGYLFSERGAAKYMKKDLTGACEDFKKAVELGDSFSQQYIDAYCK